MTWVAALPCVVTLQDPQRTLSALVYSREADDRTHVAPQTAEFCKETLCHLSLSLSPPLMDVASVAVFFSVPLRSLLLTFHTVLLLMRGLKSE